MRLFVTKRDLSRERAEGKVAGRDRSEFHTYSRKTVVSMEGRSSSLAAMESEGHEDSGVFERYPTFPCCI